MAEPISKKSGAHFRKARAFKNERDNNELRKIKPLTTFFKTNDNCDARKEPSSEHSQLISTVLQVDPNIKSHEPKARIGICKKFILKANQSSC